MVQDPSFMVGGSLAGWHAKREFIEAIAVKFNNASCTDHLGPGWVGHYVETVHTALDIPIFISLLK